MAQVETAFNSPLNEVTLIQSEMAALIARVGKMLTQGESPDGVEREIQDLHQRYEAAQVQLKEFLASRHEK